MDDEAVNLDTANNSPLAIVSANIRGLMPSKGKFKLAMLKEKALFENVAVITLTESHLNDSYLESEVHIDGFENYRADRVAGVLKGGIITYVRQDLLAGLEQKASGSIGNIEYLAIKIASPDLLLITIYRPPSSKPSDFRKVLLVLSDIISKCGHALPTIVLTGDLNFPTANWQQNTIGACTSDTREQAELLINFFNEYFMEQCVDKPTRLNNILDLFAVNNHEFIANINIEDVNQRFSDHRLVLVTTCYLPKQSLKNQEPADGSILSSLNFSSPDVDWEKINKEFAEQRWDELESGNDVDRYSTMLQDIIEAVCCKYVPKKVDRKRNIIPRDRRKLMKKRKKLRSKLVQTQNLAQLISVEQQLAQIETDLINSHERESAFLEECAVEKIRENPKVFYKYARSKSLVKTPVGPLKHKDSTVTDPKIMSEVLKKQFESVFSVPNDTIDVDKVLNDIGPRSLDDVDFTEDDIEASIMLISPSSSAGPDGVAALLLRKCVSSLKKPIYMLWRMSLTIGKFPTHMKIGLVIPIYKGGNRCLAENYRPISLTSHISKLFERVIVKALTAYLEKANLFNNNQHGFRSGRSCLSQLLEHQQEVLCALEGNTAVDVIYLDFAKAFDRVDYSILLGKLKAIGVCGQLLKWLGSFLTERRQCVKVGHKTSSEGPVHSGVPQGSSLGPLLFLILIADIDSCVRHVRVSSFADDTRFLMPIAEEDDCRKMQDDLIGVYQWAADNNMSFNNKKFQLVSYSARSRDLENINLCHKLFNYPQYFDSCGNIISSTQHVKDLGVLVSDDATFQTHIAGSVRTGTRYAGWVLRTFKTRSAVPMMKLFKSVVLPQLEYCCQLWSPLAVGTVRELEAVQRSYTSKIASLSHLNYWERLKALKLFSLERRRERYLIVYTYKIIQGIAPNFENERFKIKLTTNERRGRSITIPPLNTSATMGNRSLIDKSFPIRGPRLFNVLPARLRNFEGSVDTFKRHLDKFLNEIPDQPCIPAYQQSAPSNSIIDQLRVLTAAGSRIA